MRQKISIQPSLFLKMSQDCSVPTVEEILQQSSKGWQNQGRWTLPGQFWIHSGSDWRNDASVCSLSQILEANAPEKYFLSPTACVGILRRAEKRGKALPERLKAALAAVASPEAMAR